MSEFETEAIAAADRAAAGGLQIPDELTLSNGIVLRMKPMPPLLLNAVANSIPEPPVPLVRIPDDDREEENPNDPDYLQSLADRTAKIGLATINLILLRCTEVKTVPDGLSSPEDADWLEGLQDAGIEIEAAKPRQRYLAWLRFYALVRQQDIDQVNLMAIALAGITEGEVAEVMAAFRRGSERPADNGASGQVGNQNGHNVPVAPARASRRNRGA